MAPMAAQVHRSSRGWALALTPVAFFMVTLDALVVITALPSIHRALGASLSTLEWTVNAYTLAYAAGIITAAALGDRFGRRRLFAAGLAVFSIASAACALAPSAELLIAFRVLQGIGAAIVMPLSLTILTSAFPPERRGAIIGLWGGIAGLGVAAGPLIGGAISQGLDWHWIFWVNVPIGLAAAVLSVIRLTESYGPATRLDLPAARAAPGDGDGDAPARCGPGLDGAGGEHRRRVWAARPASGCRGNRHLDGDRGNAYGRHECGCTARHGQGLGGEQHVSALRQCLRRRSDDRGFRRQRASGHTGEFHCWVPPRSGACRGLLGARRGERARRRHAPPAAGGPPARDFAGSLPRGYCPTRAARNRQLSAFHSAVVEWVRSKPLLLHEYQAIRSQPRRRPD